MDEARIQYAQALALQSNADAGNQPQIKDKATKLLSEAIRNPDAAQILQSTSDGVQLLQSLNLQTPDMIRAARIQEEQDRLFPELKLLREGAESTTWSAASAKFKEAEATIDKEIIQLGKGKSVSESLEKVKTSADSTAAQLIKALVDFKEGRRDLNALPGQGTAQKDADAKAIRAIMNGDATANPPVPPMTTDQMMQGLLGQKGPDVQIVMQRVLNDSEVSSVNNLIILAQKAQNVSLIRVQHASIARQFASKAAESTDPALRADAAAARSEADAAINGIETVDPVTFHNNQELLKNLR